MAHADLHSLPPSLACAAPSKVVGGQTYMHADALPLLDGPRLARVVQAERLAGVKRHEHFNLVRLDDKSPRIALLSYPDFAADPFPALRESWLVDLDSSTVSYRTYAESLNPPILHRKELLLLPDDPRRETYAALTRTAESIGLFDEPKRIGYRHLWLALVRDIPSPRQPEQKPRRDRATERYDLFREPLERLWAQWLTLGRKPDESEVDDLAALTAGFGSLAKTLRFLRERHDPAEIERAAAIRTADLGVYLALNQFERRRPYKHLERGLQRDIKAFFDDYRGAQAAAKELLFRIADVEAIGRACQRAAERGLGWLEEGESLQLHTSMVDRLPPLLRVYVGCAAVLYGDYRNADLVKIHIRSGKVSLMRYDHFESSPLPRMIERVKIKLREQNIDYFAYGQEYEPPFLYYKSRYINEEFPRYSEQVEFEQALEDLGLFDLSGYGPAPAGFLETLTRNRWVIDGFELVRSLTIAQLDDPCGRYFAFRQLIECGETQARVGLANLPKRPESYNALHDLAARILDPVIDYFGMIQLTYGFCSPELAKKIPGRIEPKLDQHAAHELNHRGNPICVRLGAAVDFIVADESMLEVAQWIVAHTPFDRLYFYGDDQPIHVSFGPNHDRQVVLMLPRTSDRLVPKVLVKEKFLALQALELYFR